MDYSHLQQADPDVYQLLVREQQRQQESIGLIPSENYVSAAVLEALGSVFTDKYAEGYPGKRYYAGQVNMDAVEELAIARAKQLFDAEHVNVQPLSGAPANLAVYQALLQPGDTILGMDLSYGVHLTHGAPVTHISRWYNFVRYTVKNMETGEIDYNELRELALQHKPKLILAGFSAYPREIDYAKFKAIAEEVGAITMMDAAHIAGLIAGKQLRNPFADGFDIVTTTTHKTLRGPRGGMIMCKQEFAKAIDKSVFPGLQGGPHMNNIAAKAVAFHEALQPEFQTYAAQVITNAQVLAEELMASGAQLITNGTSNHLMLIDVVKSFDMTGNEAQELLEQAGIVVNKNVIADDPRSPLDPSGIRLGTPAVTTQGMKEEHMKLIAELIIKLLTRTADVESVRHQTKQLAIQFPLPSLT